MLRHYGVNLFLFEAHGYDLPTEVQVLRQGFVSPLKKDNLRYDLPTEVQVLRRVNIC